MMGARSKKNPGPSVDEAGICLRVLDVGK